MRRPSPTRCSSFLPDPGRVRRRDALTTREVGGGQVYVIELGDEAGSTLEFGIVGDYLVVGKGDAVDRFGEEATGSLAENAQFQAVMDTLPVEYNGLTYIDLAQAIPLMEVAAQESEDLGLGGGDGSRTPARAAPTTRLRKKRRRHTTPQSPGRSISTRTSTARSARTTSAATPKRMRSATAVVESAEPADALADVDYSAIKALALSRTKMVMFNARRPSSTSPSRLSVSRQARRS